MSWKVHFQNGVLCYKSGKHEDALNAFSQALESGGESQYIVYDSRAAVHEKLDNPKDALRDAKKAIDLAPEKWQGYSRAARLFLKGQKFKASDKMVDMAIKRLKPEDTKRKAELSYLKQEIQRARLVHEDYLRRTQNQFLKLPMELFINIVQILLEYDYSTLIPLLHICKSWRNTIINVPSLWHTLVLNKRRLKDKAKLWVQRSNGRIRNLKVSAAASVNVQDWWSFVKHVEWQSLRSCKVYGWDIADFLKKAGKFDGLVNLEQIELDDTGYKNLDRIPILRQNPALRRLSLTEIPFPSPSSLLDEDEEEPLNLTCHNIAQLSIRVGPEGNMLSAVTYFLNNSLNLQTLVMDTTINRSIATLPRIKARTLHMLTALDITNVEWAAELLSVTVFPSLEILRLSKLTRNLDGALMTLSQTVPLLTELQIRSCLIANAETLIQFLKATPLVQTLEMSSLTDISGKVLEVLAPFESKNDANSSNTPDALCPSLTRLNVSYCNDVKTGPLHRLVKARLPDSSELSQNKDILYGKSRMKSLVVDGCHHVDSEWAPWFRKNVDFFSCVYMSKKTASYKR
ncbi:hypothetical protein BDQ17DRAFT_1231550 [Cyathus striatus]|nr:hypothetical protein BDQ17DRAFT_1231550 [Cyathus striatus]